MHGLNGLCLPNRSPISLAYRTLATLIRSDCPGFDAASYGRATVQAIIDPCRRPDPPIRARLHTDVIVPRQQLGRHGGSGCAHSVWWTWTAPTTGQITLDTTGSGLDTLLAVYTGAAVSALSSVASNDNASASAITSSLLFQAQAGTQYQIAIDGANGAAGATTLHWSLNTAAAADLSAGISGPVTGVFGEAAACTVTVANAGPQSATNVVATIALPTDATFISGAGCSASGNLVVCATGTLGAGDSTSHNIVIIWTDATPATTLAVSVGSDLPDPIAGDNAANFTVAVSDSADVPTLPEWAALLLAAWLLAGAVRVPSCPSRAENDIYL